MFSLLLSNSIFKEEIHYLSDPCDMWYTGLEWFAWLKKSLRLAWPVGLMSPMWLAWHAFPIKPTWPLGWPMWLMWTLWLAWPVWRTSPAWPAKVYEICMTGMICLTGVTCVTRMTQLIWRIWVKFVSLRIVHKNGHFFREFETILWQF